MIVWIIEITVGIVLAKYTIEGIDIYLPKAKSNVVAYFKRKRNVKNNDRRLERMINNAKRRR